MPVPETTFVRWILWRVQGVDLLVMKEYGVGEQWTKILVEDPCYFMWSGWCVCDYVAEFQDFDGNKLEGAGSV